MIDLNKLDYMVTEIIRLNYPDSLDLLMRIRHNLVVNHLLSMGYTLPDINQKPMPDLCQNGINYDVTFSTDSSIIKEKEDKGFIIINGHSVELFQDATLIRDKITLHLSEYSMVKPSSENAFFIEPTTDTYDFTYEVESRNINVSPPIIPSIKESIEYLNSNRGNIIMSNDCKNFNCLFFGNRYVEPTNHFYIMDHLQLKRVKESSSGTKHSIYSLKNTESIKLMIDLPRKGLKDFTNIHYSSKIQLYPKIEALIKDLSEQTLSYDLELTLETQTIQSNKMIDCIAVMSSLCEDLLFMSLSKMRNGELSVQINKKYGILIMMTPGPPLTKKGTCRFYKLIYYDYRECIQISGWRSIKSNNINYMLGLHRFWQCYSTIIRLREPMLNNIDNYICRLALISYTNNNSFNNMLCNLRYIHMNLISKQNNIGLLLSKKFDKPLRYNYMSHILYTIIININRYKYNIVPIVKETKLDDISQEAITFSCSSLLGASVVFSDPRSLINEFYTGYLLEVNPENKMSAMSKVVEKMAEMLEKEKLTDKLLLKEINEPIKHDVWYSWDYKSSGYMIQRFLNSNTNINNANFWISIQGTRVTQNISSLGNLNGSCDFYEPKNGNSLSSFESIYQLMNYYNSTEVFKIAEHIVNSNYQYVMRIADKVQHGGERELMVQDPSTKICNVVCESIFESLCKLCPSEMLTKRNQKLYSQMDMTIESKDTITIYENGDNSSWGPNMVPLQFTLMLPFLKNIIGDRLCIFLEKHFQKMSSKCLILPKNYTIEGKNLELMSKVFLDNIGAKREFIQWGNMGQGIMHYCSSFWHAICAFNTDMDIKEKIKGVTQVNSILSSDDIFRVIRIDKKTYKASDLNLIQDIELSNNRKMNIIKNYYKSTYSSVINEFNSQFALGGSYIVPDMVFLLPLFQFEPSEDQKNVCLKMFSKIRIFSNKTVSIKESELAMIFSIQHYSILLSGITLDPNIFLIKLLGLTNFSLKNKKLLKPEKNLEIIRRRQLVPNFDLILPMRDTVTSGNYIANIISRSRKGYELIDRSFSILRMIIRSRKEQPELLMESVSYPVPKLYNYIDDFTKNVKVTSKSLQKKKYGFSYGKILTPIMKFKNSVEVLYCIKNDIKFDNRFIKDYSTLNVETKYALGNDIELMRDSYELLQNSLPDSYTYGSKNMTLFNYLCNQLSVNYDHSYKYFVSSNSNEYVDMSLYNLNRIARDVLDECVFLLCVERDSKKVFDKINDLILKDEMVQSIIFDISKYYSLKKLWDIASLINPHYHNVSTLNPIRYKFIETQKWDDKIKDYDYTSDCVIMASSIISNIKILIKDKNIVCEYFSVDIVDTKNLCKLVFMNTIGKHKSFNINNFNKTGDVDIIPLIDSGCQIKFIDRLKPFDYEPFFQILDAKHSTEVSVNDLSIISSVYGTVKFPLRWKLPDNYSHPLNYSYSDLTEDMIMDVYLNYCKLPELYKFDDKPGDDNISDEEADMFTEADYSLNLGANTGVEIKDYGGEAIIDLVEGNRSRYINTLINKKIFKHYCDLFAGCLPGFISKIPHEGLLDAIKSTQISKEYKSLIILAIVTGNYEYSDDNSIIYMDIFDEIKIWPVDSASSESDDFFDDAF